jgi:hypothetical protein
VNPSVREPSTSGLSQPERTEERRKDFAECARAVYFWAFAARVNVALQVPPDPSSPPFLLVPLVPLVPWVPGRPPLQSRSWDSCVTAASSYSAESCMI